MYICVFVYLCIRVCVVYLYMPSQIYSFVS